MYGTYFSADLLHSKLLFIGRPRSVCGLVNDMSPEPERPGAKSNQTFNMNKQIMQIKTIRIRSI